MQRQMEQQREMHREKMEAKQKVHQRWLEAIIEQLPAPCDGPSTVSAASITSYDNGATDSTMPIYKGNLANAVPKQKVSGETVIEKPTPSFPKGTCSCCGETGHLAKDFQHIKAECHYWKNIFGICMYEIHM